MADPIVLFGESTVLAYKGVSDTYVSIGNRISISGPDRERAVIETTVQGNGTMRTYRPSNLIQPGKLELKVYYNPSDTTHTTLQGMLTASPATATKTWKMTFSDGATEVFDGFVTAFKVSGMDFDKNVEAAVSIQISGVSVLTPFTHED